MNKIKTVTFWIVIVVSAMLLWQVLRAGKANPPPPDISYSAFVSRVAQGQVSKVVVTGNEVLGYDTKGGTFHVTVPPNQVAMLDALQQHGAEIWFRDVSAHWPYWVLNCSPLVLMIILCILVVRRR